MRFEVPLTGESSGASEHPKVAGEAESYDGRRRAKDGDKQALPPADHVRQLAEERARDEGEQPAQQRRGRHQSAQIATRAEGTGQRSEKVQQEGCLAVV